MGAWQALKLGQAAAQAIRTWVPRKQGTSQHLHNAVPFNGLDLARAQAAGSSLVPQPQPAILSSSPYIHFCSQRRLADGVYTPQLQTQIFCRWYIHITMLEMRSRTSSTMCLYLESCSLPKCLCLRHQTLWQTRSHPKAPFNACHILKLPEGETC